MDAIEVIEAALAAELLDEDGDPVELDVEPGAGDAEIDEIEREAGAPLPRELRAILARTGGIEGSVAADLIDFTGRSMAGEQRAGEFFPHGLVIAGDGSGNFWVVDLLPGEHEHGAVFFLAHDPPVVVFQSASIAEFLAAALTGEPDTTLRAQRELSRDDALRAGGAPAALAASLPDGFAFFDLRDAPPGSGFEWALSGPDTRVVRHATERVFAVERSA